MLVARLACSDPNCAAEVEAEGLTLAELETLVCDCGCALDVIAWPDGLVRLSVRAPAERRAA